MMDEATELRLRQPHFRDVVANKKQVDGRVFFPGRLHDKVHSRTRVRIQKADLTTTV